MSYNLQVISFDPLIFGSGAPGTVGPVGPPGPGFNAPQNADATGINDAFPQIQAAASLGEVYVPKGTYRMGSNLTINVGLRFASGAVLKPDAGVTVTIAGPLMAPRTQIFDQSASGTVSFGSGASCPQVYPEWWGAVGDGSTNDGPAVLASVQASAIAKAPASIIKAHAVDRQIALPDNAQLDGGGTGSLVASTAIASVVAAGNNTRISNLTLDGANLVTSAVAVCNGKSNVRYKGMYAKNGTVGVQVNNTTDDVQITESTADGCSSGIVLRDSCTRTLVRSCTVTNWTSRAITYLAASSASTPGDIWIENNIVKNLISINPSDSRTAIWLTPATGGTISSASITGNHIYGRGTSYTDPTTPGIGDGISPHGVLRCVVADNVILDSGDGGISGSNCVSWIIRGNHIVRADSVGIFTSAASQNANFTNVTGNMVYNCGQNRQGDRKSPAGVKLLAGSSNVVVEGNNILDDQTTPTCQVGIYADGVTNGRIGENKFQGIANPILVTTACTGVTVAPRFVSAAPTNSLHQQGEVFYNTGATASGTVGWVCTTAGGATSGLWAATTSVTAGTWVVNSSGKIYAANTSGITGSSEPNTGGTIGSATVTDGTVTWIYWGTTQAVFKTFGAISA